MNPQKAVFNLLSLYLLFPVFLMDIRAESVGSVVPGLWTDFVIFTNIDQNILLWVEFSNGVVFYLKTLRVGPV